MSLYRGKKSRPFSYIRKNEMNFDEIDPNSPKDKKFKSEISLFDESESEDEEKQENALNTNHTTKDQDNLYNNIEFKDDDIKKRAREQLLEIEKDLPSKSKGNFDQSDSQRQLNEDSELINKSVKDDEILTNAKSLIQKINASKELLLSEAEVIDINLPPVSMVTQNRQEIICIDDSPLNKHIITSEKEFSINDVLKLAGKPNEIYLSDDEKPVSHGAKIVIKSRLNGHHEKVWTISATDPFLKVSSFFLLSFLSFIYAY